jgi:hypothetical protein
MPVINRMRGAAATSLLMCSQVLRVAAGVADLAAREVRGAGAPPERTGRDRPAEEPRAPADTTWDAAALRRLAAGSARQVIATLPQLRSEALYLLYELEADGSNRSSVLDAIERRLLPG